MAKPKATRSLLRRDEKRDRRLSADAAAAERLPIALTRLEHRKAKLLRRQDRDSVLKLASVATLVADGTPSP
jgi:hypothetical protein